MSPVREEDGGDNGDEVMTKVTLVYPADTVEEDVGEEEEAEEMSAMSRSVRSGSSTAADVLFACDCNTEVRNCKKSCSFASQYPTHSPPTMVTHVLVGSL